MDVFLNFFTLLGVGAIIFGVFLMAAAPYLLVGVAASKRDEAERRLIQQAELDRKIAIAEASIAARARGETFLPPPDYNR